ncbi:MAG: dephospho-CoA kinase [Planctomycetaceae bacterium]|jgi:dephospho-CoA kinase|nr:dephospho-CoA kinase [Planctomycetaceae bacterium]MDC0308146.1 dephospho-CoA kinase [Planctomycetaceae bacterium]MDG2390257.1 dephospho-CoA kinase [Planctomycetaceae bacterium]
MTISPRNVGLPVVGIVGGIGSGKSAVAREASRIRPWYVVDADQIGHQTLLLPEVITKLTEQFGNHILDADGQLDRSAIAKEVFGPNQIQQKQQLEAIVHPHIRRLAADQLAEAAQSGQYQLLILDAAILFEANWHHMCDAVVFVDTNWEQRLQRVKQIRNWDADELTKREASQLPIHKKQKLADAVIPNHGELSAAVEALIAFADQRFPNPQSS